MAKKGFLWAIDASNGPNGGSNGPNEGSNVLNKGSNGQNRGSNGLNRNYNGLSSGFNFPNRGQMGAKPWGSVNSMEPPDDQFSPALAPFNPKLPNFSQI